MRYKLALSIALLAFPCRNANAMTGAEFLQIEKAFGIGYVLGVVDTRISLVFDNDPHFDRLRACIIKAKMTSETIYDLVVRHLQQSPSSLPEPAVAAIINTVNEMCP